MSADAAQIWDTTTWLRIVPPLRHSDRLTGAVHSPNGRQIATAGRDGLVRLWNLPSEAPHSWKQVGKDKLDTAPIAFTDQSRKLATIGFGTDGAFRIYDRASNALSYPAISTQPKTQLGNFSPDGRYFIVTLTTGDVQLFQTIDGKPSGAPLSHGSPLNGITYSPDGKYLVTSTSDNKVRVWDLDSRTLANGPFQMKGWISALGISPDTSCIGVAEISRWRSLNRATGADIFPPVEVKGEILDLAFSPDGSMLAVAVRESLVANGWGLVFDAMTGKPITAPLRHVNPVGKVAWHPDGTILATGDFFGSVRLWQIPTSTPLCDYLSHPDNIVRLQFSADGRVLFADASNGPFSSRVWDGRTGEPLGPPRLPGMQTSDAIMGADGRYLALRSGDNRVFAVELKEDARSVDEIYRISKLLSARIVDAAGTSVPVTKSELIEGWKVFGETLQAGADFNGAMVNSKSMTPAQSAR